MDEGFTYLETGKYSQAEVFFKEILADYPENKTARICYGRAIGLNNNAEKANEVFAELLAEHPDDLEVQLNYGESLLWNNSFSKAKSYYTDLVEDNPSSFPALLGYANTLSNLKEFENALVYVNKALEVLPGNPNALTSKKYIYLGYAYQNQQQQNYEEAEALLLENLELFEMDTETMLNLGNLYIIADQLDKAKSTYSKIAEMPESQLKGLNGLALVAHLDGKDKEALVISEQAIEALNTTQEETITNQTQERYIQSLIWNNKYKEADAQIQQLVEIKPDENWVLALRATLNIYKSDFKKSVKDYEQILDNEKKSFDGNLGNANALKALGYYNDAYRYADSTLVYYENQKDATAFIQDLNTRFTTFLESKASYTFDNGDNIAYALQNTVEVPLSTKLSLMSNFGYRNTSNEITVNEATSSNVSLGFSYQLANNLTFKGSSGVSSANAKTQNYAQLLTDVSFHIIPYKLQILDVGYKREIQSFNAELLDREIVMNNFYANYNMSTNFKLGWYSQYYYTLQNDDNTRNLFFTSLYYNLLKKPSLKAGLNYQYITFSKQLPTIYFSPKKFNAVEIFMNIISDEVVVKPKEWFYEFTAATGYQFIEESDQQWTYRLQGKLGYKVNKRFLVNLYGTHSNIASATAAGFTFTELGLRLKWYLFETPFFRK
ncbi:hypothetical protein GCM10007940_37030 [Portibacter lacus]|uniref:Tetratricopeptide repeat protein n=2 Tax=Portibacter lacus TaxID=1099794 RepID=A0AA37SSC3_9BACT|nr:hypothetical protein GCM10007940_37030 [Portibacter lacus]